LRNAARRGVSVKVILAGKSDIMLSKNAERYLYDWLLRKKIGIYEFQPTVLHAKITVCDSEIVTIGSFNVNNISAYASLELNLDVKHKRIRGIYRE
jgi:cardiolipin synthase